MSLLNSYAHAHIPAYVEAYSGVRGVIQLQRSGQGALHTRKHNLELAKITKCTFASLLPAALADLATVLQQQHMKYNTVRRYFYSSHTRIRAAAHTLHFAVMCAPIHMCIYYSLYMYVTNTNQITIYSNNVMSLPSAIIPF